jgi:hypothetical protein
MLSRIAESLFWIGRYIERADGTARIVDVLRLQLLEDPAAQEGEAARTVLSVIMGMPSDGAVGFTDVGDRLVFDRQRTPVRSPERSWQLARMRGAPAKPSRQSSGRRSTPRGIAGRAWAVRT